jgi:hypothetical protein
MTPMTPKQRQQLRAALKLLDNAYAIIAEIAKPQRQEPSGGQFDWTGWQDDGTSSNASEWSWEEPRGEK